MFQKLFNQVLLGLVVRPRGPILVKSGVETPDPTRPGMEFVRTHHAELGDTVYLPGTSLKGAIRAHAERSLAGLGVKVCNPLDRKLACHGSFGHQDQSSGQIFRRQCPVCRTFGSLHLSGRTHVVDAYPWPTGASPDAQRNALANANRTETRWQVAIDRESGQARGGALFDLEVVVSGEFHAEVQMRNVQLWQLGLVAGVLREMNEGHVPLGFGKSRGLGQVSADIESLCFGSIDRDQEAIRGTAELSSEEEQADYGLLAGSDSVLTRDLPSDELIWATTWRGTELKARGPALSRLLDQVVDGPLRAFVDSKGLPTARGIQP